MWGLYIFLSVVWGDIWLDKPWSIFHRHSPSFLHVNWDASSGDLSSETACHTWGTWSAVLCKTQKSEFTPATRQLVLNCLLIKVHVLARTEILSFMKRSVPFPPWIKGLGRRQGRTSKETRLLHVNNPQPVNAKQRSLPDCNKFCNDTAKYLPAVVLLAQAVGNISKASLFLSASLSLMLAALHWLLGSMTEAAMDSK